MKARRYFHMYFHCPITKIFELRCGKKSKADNPNDGLYVEAKQESTLFNLYTKKSDNIAISTSITPDIYALVHPLLSLSEKLANDEENQSYRVYFDKGVFTGESIIADLSAKASSKVFAPSLAPACAASHPACPAPTTTMSYDLLIL